MTITAPVRECPLCPRLVHFRSANKIALQDGYNGAVPAFGNLDARLLVIGLAPGLHGANRTGRPFTGDYAGDLLYPTLQKFGWASGRYDARPDDGFTLQNVRITNAVRCVPPANKPTPVEINTCRRFLSAEITAMTNLKHLLVLGRVAHASALQALDHKLSRFPFKHGVRYVFDNGLTLHASYHCSRYNTNTGRLTTAMFEAVVAGIPHD